MAKSIDPSSLGKVLHEHLTLYHEDVVARVNSVGEKSIRKLVNLTRKDAPVQTGKYAKSITHTAETAVTGDKLFTWGAKGIWGRLTHLLVRGHATLDGGRTKGDPFLENALDTVLPEYEKDVEEALKND